MRSLPYPAAGCALLLLLSACAEAPLPDRPAPGAPVALELDTVRQTVAVTDPTPTPSAIWDRALQGAVLRKEVGPPVAARAAAILHTALYDVWAAYDPVAIGSETGDALQRPAELNTEALKAEAMSHAAYVLLSGMFPEDAERFDAVMDALGYETDPIELSERPAGLGRVVASRVMTRYRRDGSNWDNSFEDTTGYVPANASPTELRVMDRWTPENTPIDPETGVPDQEFITPQWAVLRPITLSSPGGLRPRPPEPFLRPGLTGTVDLGTRRLTLADGRVLPVTPELVGPVINPAFIAQAEHVVAASAALSDRQKMIAEFWEDNKETAFPPGTWLTFAQYVSARDDHSLDQDAPFFFAVAVALFDASIATWEAKRHYDYVRPVRAIRALGRLGLIGRPGVDELTGEAGHVIEAWGGPGLGTRTVLASRFLSYQRPDADPSPPFPEYPSGHSAFSAAAAEVMRALTGSDRFGGEVIFPAGSSRFEPGTVPAADVSLVWPSFTDAAAEAGVSRIYGGIHFTDGDIEGRRLGRMVGRSVTAHVEALRAGRKPGS